MSGYHPLTFTFRVNIILKKLISQPSDTLFSWIINGLAIQTDNWVKVS